VVRFSSRLGDIRYFAKMVDIAGLKVDENLISVVEKDIAPGTGIEASKFWASFAEAVKEFGPRTKQLLEKRDVIQSKIDAWHQERRGKPLDMVEYKAFLQSIG
jgi:malate synthase